MRLTASRTISRVARLSGLAGLTAAAVLTTALQGPHDPQHSHHELASPSSIGGDLPEGDTPGDDDDHDGPIRNWGWE